MPRTSLVNLFSGVDDEDAHPPGCRHVGMAVESCPETYSTMLVGGMGAIAEEVRRIERLADELDSGLGVDMQGMDVGVHSIVLFCEVCKMHSVVSWENYRDVCEKSGRGSSCRPPGDYYLSMVATSPLLRTPGFDTDPSGSSSGRNRPMNAILIYTEEDAEVVMEEGVGSGSMDPNTEMESMGIRMPIGAMSMLERQWEWMEEGSLGLDDNSL